MTSHGQPQLPVSAGVICGVGGEFMVDITRPVCFSAAVFAEGTIFPLPLLLLSSTSSTSPTSLSLLNDAITGLNSLHAGLDGVFRCPSSTLTSTQVLLVDSLVARIASFISTGSGDFAIAHDQLPSSSLRMSHLHSYQFMSPLETALNKGLLEPQSDASILTRGSFKQVDCNRVALPGPGKGACVSILDWLPPEVASQYATSSHTLVVPPPSREKIERYPIQMGVKKGHYPLLINRLLEAGCVKLLYETPVCVNGLFAVAKDATTDRLIFDGRRANLYFVPPPSPELLSPSDLAELIIEPGRPVYVSKSDVSNMYNLLRVPEWMITFLALPPIRLSSLGKGGKSLVWPAFVSLPMGHSHAVYIAHSLHQHVVRCSLPLPIRQLVSPNTRWSESTSAFFSYIDDHGFITASAEEACLYLHQSVAALDSVGLHHHPKKIFLPTHGFKETEVLGIGISVTGRVFPERSRLKRLMEWTNHVLETETATLSTLQRIIGSWIWFLLLKRPFLAALENVFAFTTDAADQNIRERTITAPVAAEFRRLIHLAPLLDVDLATPFADIVFATDASMTGGAVVSTPVSVKDQMMLLRYSQRKGWSSWQDLEHPSPTPKMFCSNEVKELVSASQWKVELSVRWKFEEPCIVILEAQALVLALKIITSRPELHAKRIAFFVDSTSLLGAVAKGRSSSRRLNRIFQKISSLLIVANVRPIWLWIPSEYNPADTPSRL